MTINPREESGPYSDDDAQLDALLAATWQDGAAALARRLDLEAGKAALLAAFQRQEASRSAERAELKFDSALSAVCDEIDMLLAVLALESDRQRGPAHSAVSTYLMSSHQLLVQLRDGLTSRSITRHEAERLHGGVEHALTQAHKRLWQLLPVTPGSPSRRQTEDLKTAVSDTRQRLPGLRANVALLFDDASGSVPHVPIPRR